MSKIVMTISAESPEELFSTIRGAALLISDSVPAALPDSTQGAVAVPTLAPGHALINPTFPQTNTSPAVPVQPTPAVASAPATPMPTVAPIAPVAPVAPPVRPPVAPAPAYTYEQVGKAGADLAAANPGIMPTLMALLQRYGVQQVTELKPDQLGPFATELRGLGAKL